jgi:ArsR family transcriptional regulator
METSIFEALADENRLAIVELLADGERCVCDVSGSLGISNALASHHLKRLRETGIVITERRGSWLHCRLAEGVLDGLAAELQELARRGAAISAKCCTPACCRKEDET